MQWHIFEAPFQNCLERLRKTKNIFSRYIRIPDRDLKQGPSRIRRRNVNHSATNFGLRVKFFCSIHSYICITSYERMLVGYQLLLLWDFVPYVTTFMNLYVIVTIVMVR
jgi:hypothetical protein